MAIATGLAKSRVDQIIRENYLASGSGKVAALMANDAAPDSSRHRLALICHFGAVRRTVGYDNVGSLTEACGTALAT